MKSNIGKFFVFLEENLSVVLFFAMTCITCMNVFTRFLLSYTASWAEQTVRVLFIWVGYAGVCICARKDTNLKVEALPSFLPPRGGALVRSVGDLVSIVFGYYISWKILGTTMNLMATNQTFPAMPTVPVWIMYIAGALGMFGFACRMIPNFFRHMRQALGQEAIPAKTDSGEVPL